MAPIAALISLIIAIVCIAVWILGLRRDDRILIVPSVVGFIFGNGIFFAWLLFWFFSQRHCSEYREAYQEFPYVTLSENVFAAPGIDVSATRYRCSKDISVLPVVMPELKLRNIYNGMYFLLTLWKVPTTPREPDTW